MIRVSITDPEGDDFVVDIEGDTAVVGRSPDADVTVPNALVSARHLRVDAGAIVRDLKSRNGTWTRGARLSGPTMIGDNDLVLGPDPVHSPTLRIEIIVPDDDDESHELGERTVLSRPRKNGIPDGAVDADGAARRAVRRNVPPAPPDSTVVHPLVSKNRASSRFGDADDSARAFIVDACLQSLRSLESFASPMDISTAAAAHAEAASAEILEAVDDVVARNSDSRTRQHLMDVLDAQRRRILDRHHAYRRAATALVEELRDRVLEEASGAEYGAIPLWKRLLGLRSRILWTRAKERLDRYDRYHVESRLDELAREDQAGLRRRGR